MGFKEKVSEGMSVRSPSGARLGKIRRLDGDTFEIEKGVFFKDHYLARYDEVESIDSDRSEVVLSMSRAGKMGGAEATSRFQEPVIGKDEARMRLHEEQLEVTKHQRDTGEVKVTKHITTEHKTMTVPVTRERVKVERTPIDREAAAGDDFGEQEFRIPLKDEELEVRKRTVVREEVRVAKTADTEMREVQGDLRHEEVEIETAGGRSYIAGNKEP